MLSWLYWSKKRRRLSGMISNETTLRMIVNLTFCVGIHLNIKKISNYFLTCFSLTYSNPTDFFNNVYICFLLHNNYIKLFPRVKLNINYKPCTFDKYCIYISWFLDCKNERTNFLTKFIIDFSTLYTALTPNLIWKK